MRWAKWLIICLAIVVYSTSKPVTIKWDAGAGVVDHYELVLIRDVSLTEYWYGATSTQITVPKPKSGKYEVRVRAVNFVQGLPQTSTWCSSLDENCSQLKNGNKGAWKLFWKPSTPLGPIIITPKSSYWWDRMLVDFLIMNGGLV
jgi:hypothetical protein